MLCSCDVTLPQVAVGKQGAGSRRFNSVQRNSTALVHTAVRPPRAMTMASTLLTASPVMFCIYTYIVGSTTIKRNFGLVLILMYLILILMFS